MPVSQSASQPASKQGIATIHSITIIIKTLSLPSSLISEQTETKSKNKTEMRRLLSETAIATESGTGTGTATGTEAESELSVE